MIELEPRILPSVVLTVEVGDMPAAVDMPVAVSVRCTDAWGNPIKQANVGATLVSDRGDLVGNSAAFTDSAGIAHWSLVGFGLPGGHYLTAFVGGLESASLALTVYPTLQPINYTQGLMITPTLANIHYGAHARQTFDYYRAAEDNGPLVVWIHGGGWYSGDKSTIPEADLAKYLRAGINVAAINYRYLAETETNPPVADVLGDVSNAIHYLVTRATDLRFDVQRIGLSGGSAGGAAALWYAFRNPNTIAAVAVNTAQTTLDPVTASAWVPGWSYGYLAFGYNTYDTFAADVVADPTVEAEVDAYSADMVLTTDAPPVYMIYYDGANATHDYRLGLLLAAKLDVLELFYELNYPGHATAHASEADYLIDRLTTPEAIP